jgi:membrane protein DedA with SNARE-associated domain
MKIWIVPGYIFAYVYGESRSRYLRAITAGVVAIILMFAVHVYEWNRQAQERERASHRAVDP